MIADIISLYNQEKKKLPSSKLNTCVYCGKQYKRLSTLATHLCEPKRRANQEKDVGVQFGLQAFLRFYEVTQGSAKNKTYAEFAKSTYYKAFVKFGRYIVDIRAVNPKAFIEYVIKQNKRLDNWCREAIYIEYLNTYTRREATQDALERSVIEMARNDKNVAAYFTSSSANKICQDIVNGRVSAWVIYNSASGVDFLSTLNEEQVTKIMPWIDPTYWQKKFTDYPADAIWVKNIMDNAGL